MEELKDHDDASETLREDQLQNDEVKNDPLKKQILTEE
jgi:hypothetical protein